MMDDENKNKTPDEQNPSDGDMTPQEPNIIPPFPGLQSEESSEEPETPVQEAEEREAAPTDFSEDDTVVPFSDEQNTSVSSLGAGAVFRWFFIFALVLVLAFYVLLIYALLSGDVSNPLFDALNIHAAQLKSTLLWLTNTIFFSISLILFFALLIRFFQWIMLPKESAKKKEHIKKAGMFLVLFLVTVGVWLGMFILISRANAGPAGIGDNIILTEPPSVIGLNSPVTVEFDIGKMLFQRIDKDLVRKIDWDFDGDGTIDASGPKVNNRFLDKGLNSGRYPVNVTVSYQDPETKETRQYVTNREVIIENEKVVADFSLTPERGPSPMRVLMDASVSRDPDGNIVLYEWDLNDDGDYEISGAEEIIIEEIFSEVGDIPIRLRVTGTNKDVSVLEKTLSVTSPEENLRAEINSLNPLRGEAPYELRLDASQSFSRKGPIVKYEWHVDGEEKRVISKSLKRTFRVPGEYKVTLTIYDAENEKDQETVTVAVAPKGSEADLVIRTTPSRAEKEDILTGEVPFEVTFDSSPSKVNTPIEWRWDFQNDGIDDLFGRAVKYTFREPGVYDVKLTVVDGDEQEFSEILRVIANPSGVRAVISADPIGGAVPLRVQFDGSGSTTDRGEIINYIWKFPGEEPISYSAKITKEFRTVGIYDVGLTVLTSDGKTATTSRLISVRTQDVVGKFTPTPANGAAPLTVQFDPTNSQGTIREYYWDFGDGEKSRQFKPSHTYTEPGEYKVVLTLLDQRGIVTEHEEMVTVTEPEEEVEVEK